MKGDTKAYMAFAFGSIVASAILRTLGQANMANFIGLWPPTILALGLMNKIDKLEQGRTAREVRAAA